MKKIKIIIIFMFLHGFSQENGLIINVDSLNPFFEKLHNIKDTQKVKILHIGDSHIQGNFFTQATREILQAKFGNGGFGFIFPYNLAKTNSETNKFINFSSDAVWQSCRISMKSKCTTEIILGISGHGLFTENQNFEISLEVPQNYNFNKIIIFYPNINSSFSIENDLGAANLISVFTENQFFKGFETFVPMDKIRIRPDHNYNYYNFNGAYIENEKYGIVYNSIGINGAKAGDFLQNPIFFEQISAISPDLLVLSFGTNEAFSEIFPQIFISQIDTLVSKIREKCGEIPVLITTPPFSSAKKNGTWFISQYSKNLTNCKNYAVWNLHELTQKSVLKDNVNSILAKDKIHYTQDGYRRIGGCFAETLIKHYEDFLQNLSE